MKVGILFGGPSREREISFAGGRTVFDNLDKTLFEPVPIFVDSLLQPILLDWAYIYKGTIRDFYPPVQSLRPDPNGFQIYIESLFQSQNEDYDAAIESVGKKLEWNELPQLIDFAFLALHGTFGEDGQIQGLLESMGIPYTGSGILASAIGMDKAVQKKLMKAGGFDSPPIVLIPRNAWKSSEPKQWWEMSNAEIGFPLVIRPANQGSSIGVAILHNPDDFDAFVNAVDKAFFRMPLQKSEWQKLSSEQRVQQLKLWTDIRDGVGFPLNIAEQTFYHPADLLEWLELWAQKSGEEKIYLESHHSENKVVLEGFIKGKEFSCIVIRHPDGTAVALPPTEIIKGSEVFDYRSKYLPGLSRKETPIDLPNADIERIRKETERLFYFLEFRTYARIDGFITAEGNIFLNDPNTTSGMLPSSFFFHQAAEIGLNPSQFLTFIVRTSLDERIRDANEFPLYMSLLKELDDKLNRLHSDLQNEKKKIAVILGGYSFERHISLESGRNIYEKLASSGKYDPVPIFLTGSEGQHELYKLPVNLLLKDNADDIRHKIKHFKQHSLIAEIREECSDIIQKFASADVIFEPQQLSYEQLGQMVDGAFIALHGRPGEDGAVQQHLEKLGLPYNGSGVASSSITIDKYETLQTLRRNGFIVADQMLVEKADFEKNKDGLIAEIEQRFTYPFIAKPVDDGCSSAVKVIKNQTILIEYLKAIYRDTLELDAESRLKIQLMPKEEFPQKNVVLLETLIQKGDAKHFLEVTGGMLTHLENGEITFEVFEPSEALAGGEILSLEEKFLAGEGQNITPARFSKDPEEFRLISKQVKDTLESAAKILHVEGYCRIDAFVRIYDNAKAETIIIEVNSLPGMTPATCIFHQSAINGYQPYEFIDSILDFGFKRNSMKNSMKI
jgi:UDP-N-acetylmuramate--alanine ligase